MDVLGFSAGRKPTDAEVRPGRGHQGHGGGKRLDEVTDGILEQARTLYRYWPDTFYSELPL